MKKHLLTLAGVLSLLAANQALGTSPWSLTIKNATTSPREALVMWTTPVDFQFLMKKDVLFLAAGETRSLRFTTRAVNVDGVMVEGVPRYTPKKDSHGKTINPLKGLTLKTVNGKTVIVENQ